MSDPDLDYAIALSLADNEGSRKSSAVSERTQDVKDNKKKNSVKNSHSLNDVESDSDYAFALSLSINDNEPPTEVVSVPPMPIKTLPVQEPSYPIPSAATSSNTRVSKSSSSTTSDEDYALALSLSLNEDNHAKTNPSIKDIRTPTLSNNPITQTTPLPPKPPDSNIVSNLSSFLSNSLGKLSLGEGCHVCKQSIVGGYVKIGDYTCHPGCVVCLGCNNAIRGQVHLRDDGFYHPQCADELFSQRCCLCTNKLSGTFYRNAFFKDEIYCVEHDSSRKCFSCNRKEPQASTKRESFAELPDGRTCCMECVSTAILDSSEAQPLYREVVDFMEYSLNLPIPEGMREVPILAVDLPSLNENISSAGPRNHHGGGVVRGLTLSSIGHVKYMTPGALIWDALRGQFHASGSSVYKIESTREVTAVLVLYGLPRNLTASILAHEAMHVWIRLQKDMPFYLPPKIEEGLCQVIAHKFLDHMAGINQHIGGSLSHTEQKLRDYFTYTIENDTDPIYGDGYREAKEVVDTLSLDVVLDHIRAHQALPKV